MKIAFDVSDLCTARSDGTTRYTFELAKKLPRLAPEHDWQFLAPCDETKNLKLKNDNSAWHSSPWPKYWTQSRLPIDLVRIRPDVLFMPIQQLPIIRPRRMKTVAVIHDLAMHKFSDQFTYKDWLLLQVFSAQVAHEADAIIAVSQATADDIAEHYGRKGKVHVVHHGLDHHTFHRPADDVITQSWPLLEEKYPQLRKPYILFVGQIQPRKNLRRLIAAFERIHSNHPQLRLALAGGHGWLQQPILDRVKQSPQREHIHLIGRVPDQLLPALYWHAAVFTLVSLYEGFGMPILEAMACGCPVVTSNTSSMPEIAGEAAIAVDPCSVESIAAGITQAMEKSDELKAKGIERAKHFSWEKTAEQTRRILTD